MGPRARRSSPRATQTRGPVAGTTRLDRRHEPARAQPTRTGPRRETGPPRDRRRTSDHPRTLAPRRDGAAGGDADAPSVAPSPGIPGSRSWSTSIEMRRRPSDAACSRPYAPGARRLATPATRTPRSAARENCGPDRLRLQRVSHQHPGGNERSLPRSDVPQGAAPSLRTSTSRVAEPSARPECSP